MMNSPKLWFAILSIVLVGLSVPALADQVKFRKHVINADSRFEAAGVLDVNRDGKLDIFCGGFWYESPVWKKHFVREIPELGEYYVDFANLPMDVDADGWTDVVGAAWHNEMVYWVRNPGNSKDPWKLFEVDKPGNMETAIAVDINGDGRLDILPNIMKCAAWYEYRSGAGKLDEVKWTKHELPNQAAGHGIGAGDVNSDGRCDVVASKGWLEQTADPQKQWIWHGDFDLGHTSIPILGHDVDRDHDQDIIWGMGHGYGIYWLEQGKDDKGNRIWTKHEIDKSWSQPHFLLLADLDNDGIEELVTGKRHRAHNGKDPGGNEPVCVYYYKFDATSKTWNRYTISEGDKVGLGINTMAVDIDADGDIDIVAPGKSGLYLMENLLISSPANDARLQSCRTLNDKMELRTFDSLQQWKSYRQWLQVQILVSTGLWPLPPRTPLHAKVFDVLKHDDYTVSKVQFESRPGFFVCGNLYRPVKEQGPFPGILCPHGHWKKGRFGNSERGCVQARMISFARQGYVAFSWSMVGYNDADQLKHSFHDIPWGLSLMGLQLWNSIRACDFLSSLEDVDPDRIGCTGASGGGTQTFMLTAVDDRIKVAAPVNMISAIMQGGCACENAPLLRLRANNVEIASMMAPRPLLMVSATGDWTTNTLELEYPAVQAVYKLYNAEDKVKAVRIKANHNYNLDSRNAVYPFFARWLKGVSDYQSYQENPLEVDNPEDLLVFNDKNPRPDSALNADQLRVYLIEEAKKELNSHRPKDKLKLAEFDKIYRPAYQHTFNAEQPDRGDIEIIKLGPRVDKGYYKMEDYLLTRSGTGEMLPATAFIPSDKATDTVVNIIIHPDGKAGLVQANGEPIPLIRNLLKMGQYVGSVDCFLTGGYLSKDGKLQRPLAPEQDLTYNRTDLAYRVQDILTAIGISDPWSNTVNLVGLDRAGLWVLAARPLAEGVNKTIVDADQFDAADDQSWQGDMLLPGIRRIGGLQTAGVLTAPADLVIYNNSDKLSTDWIREAYLAIEAGEKLQIIGSKLSADKIVKLLKK